MEETLRASAAQAAEAAKAQAEQNERLFRAYLSLQEQLHEAVRAIEQDQRDSSTALQERIQETVTAIEKNRTEAAIAVQETSKEITDRLQAFERGMEQNREDDLKALRSSNQLILIISSVFAGVGVLALVMASWFQLRAMNKMAELTTQHALPPHVPYQLQDAEHKHLGLPLPDGLGNALASLENRVRELEHTPHLDTAAQTDHNGHPHAAGNEEQPEQTDQSPPTSTPQAAPASASEAIHLQIAKGQALLNLNKPADALQCFEKVLESHPDHAETWIKKGAALERLKKMDEAIECYDEAIRSDESLTLAYLYKGGVYNQLERFSEALACYEQALRSQEPAAPTPVTADR